MTERTPSVTVVVVAARGGAPLTAALAASTWADAQAVLVPRVGIVVPSDVTIVDGPQEIVGIQADWVVLMGEEERLGEIQAERLRGALARAGGDEIFTLRSVATALGLSLRLRRRVARVAPASRPVVAFTGRGLEFSRAGTRTVALDVDVVGSRGGTLSEAVDVAAAEGASLAALVEATHGRVRGLVRQPVAAGLRALTGRALEGRLGFGRWVLAVLEGYRVVVTQAKIWELRRDRPVVMR